MFLLNTRIFSACIKKKEEVDIFLDTFYALRFLKSFRIIYISGFIPSVYIYFQALSI